MSIRRTPIRTFSFSLLCAYNSAWNCLYVMDSRSSCIFLHRQDKRLRYRRNPSSHFLASLILKQYFRICLFIWKADARPAGTHRFAAVCQNIKKMIPLRLGNCIRPVKTGIALCRVKNKPSVYIISLRIERFACRRFPHQLNSLRSLLRGWKRCSLST